jgi:hypothetical protein
MIMGVSPCACLHPFVRWSCILVTLPGVPSANALDQCTAQLPTEREATISLVLYINVPLSISLVLYINDTLNVSLERSSNVPPNVSLVLCK